MLATMTRKFTFALLMVLFGACCILLMREWNGRTGSTNAPAQVKDSNKNRPDSKHGFEVTPRPVSLSNPSEIPQKYRFGKNSNIPKADNDRFLLANYSPEEQAIIRAFYSSFGNTGLDGAYLFDNALSFKNQQQLDWLATNGYPLPDDILLAASMSTSELVALAKQGQFKAKALLLVREYQGAAMPSNSADSMQMEKLKELTAFRNDVLSDGSPFAGYVWAAEHMKKPNADGRAGVLAGYAFAETLGDERAAMFANEFSRSNPGMNPVEALASYKAILGAASKNPQLANTSLLMKKRRFQIF